jgi:hypothetical protein
VTRARYKGGLFAGKQGQTLRIIGDAENEIRGAISRFLHLRFVIHAITDARIVKTPDGPRRCVWPAGWPDITAILPITGEIWAIEVKTETGDLRDSQVETLPLIKASGGIVTVARDVLPVREYLNRHFEQFNVTQIDEYRREVRRIREEAARASLEREIAARRSQGARTGRHTGRRRLSRAVENALNSTPGLFDSRQCTPPKNYHPASVIVRQDHDGDTSS